MPTSPTAVARALEGAPFPWWVAGGWALDLFLGTTIRQHKDVDLAVLRRDQAALRAHLSGWDLRVRVAGEGLVAWADERWLDPPLHEIWASPARGEGPACELLLNDASGTDWVYRRDPRVTFPLFALLASAAPGLPILPPEIVLLYKSRNPRPEDEVDFRATYRVLRPESAGWLGDAIATVEPGHRWIDLLRGVR